MRERGMEAVEIKKLEGVIEAILFAGRFRGIK